MAALTASSSLDNSFRLLLIIVLDYYFVSSAQKTNSLNTESCASLLFGDLTEL